MKNKFVYALMVSVVLIAPLFVAYAYSPKGRSDPNRGALAHVSPVLESSSTNLAVAGIPGPSSSYNIEVHIRNLQRGKRIRFVSLSVLFCKNATGKRLIIDAGGVMIITPPRGGTVTIHTPTSTNANPEVTMEFTSFDYGEETIFNLDPDTFADPAYGATVSEMVGLVIQLWLEDGTTVGAAKFVTHSSGGVYAYVPSL